MATREEDGMTEPVKVDVHMHLYETPESGEWWKAGYEIFEYGEKDGVLFSDYSGTVGDAIEAMEKAGFSHGVAVNLLSVDLFRLEAIAMLPDEVQGAERERAIAQIDATMADRFRSFNRWLVGAVASVPQITPFVGVDPTALAPEENVEHLREMADRGARGIKLHPVVQQFEPGDPRMRPVYEACRDLGLTVLSHTGSTKGGDRFAEPAGFADVLRDFPGLTVLLAHLGGGQWHQTIELAQAFPSLVFDLCEIVEWTGAPNAPTAEQLAGMIGEVGPERVMLGTDFPWYDLDHTVELVMDLPVLATEQKEAILGANAVRILGLPV
jgi:predicted TIM-barrel fold metal-dependent hydrolase